MSECHKCPLNGTGSNLCLECAGVSDNQYNHGKSHVSLDASSHDLVEKLIANTANESSYEDLIHSKDYDKIMEIMRDVITAMMALPQKDMHIVGLKFTDSQLTPHSFAGIGREYGLSRQTTHARFKNALKRWPVLKILFPREINKTKGHEE